MDSKELLVCTTLIDVINNENLSEIERFLNDPNTIFNATCSIDSALYLFLTNENLVNNELLLNLFINHPNCDLNANYNYGETILHCLSLLNTPTANLAIKKLCKHPKIDPNIEFFNRTILSYAIRKNNIDAIEILLNHPKIVFSFVDLVELVLIAYNNCVLSESQDYMFKFLNYISEKNQYQAGIFTILIDKLNKKVSKTLFDNEVLLELNKIVASQTSSVESDNKKFLINNEINNKPETNNLVIEQKKLFVAVLNGNVEGVIGTLAIEGIDVNAQLESQNDKPQPRLIHFLAINKQNIKVNEQILDLLLAKGCDINGTNNSGQTLLHLLTLKGNNELCKILCARGGINLNAIDADKQTPLNIAIAKDKKEIVITLLNYESLDLNIKNSNRRNAVEEAFFLKNYELVDLMIDFAKDKIIDSQVHTIFKNVLEIVSKRPANETENQIKDKVLNLYEHRGLEEYIFKKDDKIFKSNPCYTPCDDDKIKDSIIDIKNHNNFVVNKKESLEKLHYKNYKFSGFIAISAIGLYGLPFQYSNPILTTALAVFGICNITNYKFKACCIVSFPLTLIGGYLLGDAAYKINFAASILFSGYFLKSNYNLINECKSELNILTLELNRLESLIKPKTL